MKGKGLEKRAVCGIFQVKLKSLDSSPPVWIGFIAVILSVLGLLSGLYNELLLWRRFMPRPPIDAPYIELRKSLPPETRFGYITDAAGGLVTPAMQYRTQYALAPRLVVTNSDTRYVIGHLVQPAKLPQLCVLHSLEPVVTFESGVSLLEHRPKP